MPRRRADKVDANQNQIVDELRALGLSVEVGMNDILVGHAGKSFWYELKTDAKAYVTPAQHKLLKHWKGHYKIVWSTEMILQDIGLKQ